MDRRIDGKAAIWAGLVAGSIFMGLEMILVATLGGGSPWAPPRMIGAILLGQQAAPPPATFSFGIVFVGFLIHFLLSIILAFPLAWIIAFRRLGLMASLGAGAAYGVVVYLVNFYGFTALFPWFAMARTPITLVSHLVFGAVLGLTYHALAVRHLARDSVRASPTG